MRSFNSTASLAIISLTWEPPFTLDITEIDPDITGYCVDVTSSMISHLECVNKTEFSYPVPPDAGCNTYSFTITPINIVGHGESSTVSVVGTQTSNLLFK